MASQTFPMSSICPATGRIVTPFPNAFTGQQDPLLQSRSLYTRKKTRDFLTEFGPIGVLYVLEEFVQTQKTNSAHFSEIFSRDKWLATEELSRSLRFISSNGQNHGGEGHINEAILPHLVATSCETDVMISVLEVLSATASKIQMEYKEFLSPSTSKLEKGIESIPDDLLATIFEVAVRKEGLRGPTTAKSLSHVSRRFRDIALDERSLWTTLRSNGSKEEWDAFILRSGTTSDFHVFVQICPSRDLAKWTAFLNRCWLTAPRWTTLTLTRIPDSSTPFDSPSEFGYYRSYRSPYEDEYYRDEYLAHQKAQREQRIEMDAEFVMKTFNGASRLVPTWQFPCLFELDIQSEDMKTALSWSSPNLQVLRYGGNLIPSSVFSTVTTFQYKIATSSVCDELLGFISSMPNILKLQLTVAFPINEQKVNGPLYFPPSSFCPSITSFHFEVIDQRSITEDGERFIAAFLHALRVPNLTHFSSDLRCNVQGEMAHFDLMSTRSLDGLTRALLPVDDFGPLSRPSIIHYKISLYPFVGGATLKMSPSTFAIPLERIPAVSILSFTTRARVVLTREGHAGVDGEKRPYSLREVRFKGCEQMATEDLQSTVQSLKEVGVWDTLERIVVEDCEFVEFESALETVGKERLLYFPPPKSHCNGPHWQDSECQARTGIEPYGFICEDS